MKSLVPTVKFLRYVPCKSYHKKNVEILLNQAGNSLMVKNCDCIFFFSTSFFLSPDDNHSSQRNKKFPLKKYNPT